MKVVSPLYKLFHLQTKENHQKPDSESAGCCSSSHWCIMSTEQDSHIHEEHLLMTLDSDHVWFTQKWAKPPDDDDKQVNSRLSELSEEDEWLQGFKSEQRSDEGFGLFRVM